MRSILTAALVAAAICAAQTPTSMIGDWEGVLHVNSEQLLRLALHISQTPEGALKATLDSLDQGAMGMPLTIELDGPKLKLTLTPALATYEGNVDAAATTISGTWRQDSLLPLEFHRVTSTAAAPSPIDGDWLGTLDTGAIKLRTLFHFTNTAEGIRATLDSIDQGAKGIPVGDVTLDGNSLKLDVPAVSGKFDGQIEKDQAAIRGSWSQSGTTLPLVLKRVKATAELEVRHPQNPVKPYPYREEEVAYDNTSAAGVRLAATLTMPQGKGPFPAVVLITGSGPQDRDETVFGHKPFLVLADYLTRRGIAVLRADDRGTGKSTGSFHDATTADFATDTEAGMAYLRTRPEIDQKRIGLIGHSEGGVIAPMIAARDPHVAFIVLMAGTGVSGAELLPLQTSLIEKAMGLDPKKAAADADRESQLLALVSHESEPEALARKVRELMGGAAPGPRTDAAVKSLLSPWFRFFVTYDPAPALRKVKCPVLAINGAKDVQVPPGQNLPAIRKALEAGGNRNFEVLELPGLNHLFQTAKTGAPAEYASIEETIAPAALEKIATWIAAHTRPQVRRRPAR